MSHNYTQHIYRNEWKGSEKKLYHTSHTLYADRMYANMMELIQLENFQKNDFSKNKRIRKYWYNVR